MAKLSKLTGAFGAMGLEKPAPSAPSSKGEPAQRLAGGRGRIKPGATMVTFSMRIPRAARDELASLARRRGTSIAALGLEGFSLVAERDGIRLPLE